MSKWKKPNGRDHRWNRAALIKRDGLICQLCQEPISNMSDLTLDHIIPVSRGGTDKLDNLRLAHELCNRERGNGFFNHTINERNINYGNP